MSIARKPLRDYQDAMSLIDLANPTRFLALTARVLPWLAAATVILLPAPGSMSAPRIVDDGGKNKAVYVCTAPSELGSGRCTLQKERASRH